MSGGIEDIERGKTYAETEREILKGLTEVYKLVKKFPRKYRIYGEREEKLLVELKKTCEETRRHIEMLQEERGYWGTLPDKSPLSFLPDKIYELAENREVASARALTLASIIIFSDFRRGFDALLLLNNLRREDIPISAFGTKNWLE